MVIQQQKKAGKLIVQEKNIHNTVLNLCQRWQIYRRRQKQLRSEAEWTYPPRSDPWTLTSASITVLIS